MVESPLTLKECAAVARVHYDTVRKAVRRGDLPAYTMPGGREIKVRPSDLEAWIYGQPVRPRAPARQARSTPRPADNPPGHPERLRAIEQGTGR